MLFIENPTNISSNYTLYPRNEVLAVRCRNSKSKPWIIGSVSNGVVTDTRWKCTGLAKREPLNFKWWQDKADDSNWAQAVANFSNRGDSPWRKVRDISEDAFWISTANEDDVRIFCRRRLSDVFLKRTSFSKGMKCLKSKAPNFVKHDFSFLVQIGSGRNNCLARHFSVTNRSEVTSSLERFIVEEYFPFDRSSSFSSLLKIQNGAPDIAIPGSGESL